MCVSKPFLSHRVAANVTNIRLSKDVDGVCSKDHVIDFGGIWKSILTRRFMDWLRSARSSRVSPSTQSLMSLLCSLDIVSASPFPSGTLLA